MMVQFGLFQTKLTAQSIANVGSSQTVQFAGNTTGETPDAACLLLTATPMTPEAAAAAVLFTSMILKCGNIIAPSETGDNPVAASQAYSYELNALK